VKSAGSGILHSGHTILFGLLMPFLAILYFLNVPFYPGLGIPLMAAAVRKR
jgi:hypothetical protein